jgi:hypothetical protein
MRAMSPGCPMRPRGVLAIIAFSKSLPMMPALCVPSVSTSPGAIALTRILRGPNSAASPRVIASTLEKFCANRDGTVVQFRKTLLAPLRLALGSQPFLGDTGPTYADHAVFGAFQWARTTSPFKLLEPDDPVASWRERMLDLYGGFARKSVGYPVCIGQERRMEK